VVEDEAEEARVGGAEEPAQVRAALPAERDLAGHRDGRGAARHEVAALRADERPGGARSLALPALRVGAGDVFGTGLHEHLVS
jgi:hypothetical protein